MATSRSSDPLTSCRVWVGWVELDSTDDIAAISTAIFSNVSFTGNFSTPLPPDRGKHATLRKMRSPVALELLELLTTVNIPPTDRLVIQRTDEQLRIRGA